MRPRPVSFLLAPLALYLAWLAMMATHEVGHVLHAWASGGDVRAVRIPLLGYSVTEFDANPRPHFVAWGGAVWGSALPLAAWWTIRRLRRRGGGVAQFFAGFCLVANGVYLGAGWVYGVGDAGDLLAYGTPAWVMILFGALTAPAGLYLWHRLGPIFGPGAPDA